MESGQLRAAFRTGTWPLSLCSMDQSNARAHLGIGRWGNRSQLSMGEHQGHLAEEHAKWETFLQSSLESIACCKILRSKLYVFF